MTITTCTTLRRYRSAEEADSMVAILERAHRHRDRFRRYACPKCGGWHLTTSSSATVQQAR